MSLKSLLLIHEWQVHGLQEQTVATEKIEFAGNYPVDVVGCSCEVLSGNVTFQYGEKLTLTNDLKVTTGG
jgi:hypothetical protein